jgi:hypothetical protein
MKLWTWQTADFSLTTRCVDVCKSRHANLNSVIRAAYTELAQRLETDQLVWCYTVPDQYIVLPRDPKIGWQIDLPHGHCRWFIDSWVWERLIESRACPEDIREEWARYAMLNDLDPDQYHEMKLEEYLATPAPGGSWWDCLILDDDSQVPNVNRTALVLHPLPDSAVQRFRR